VIDAICVGLLVLGAWKVVPWRGGRYLHYVFTFVAFEVYLALGPRAMALVFVSGTAGTLLHVLARPRGAGVPPVARSVGAITLAILLGMAATHALVSVLGLPYPIPYATTSDVVSFTGILCCLFATSALAKEGLLHLLAPSAPRPSDGTRPGPADYLMGAVVGGPLHHFAHPLFVRGQVVAWVAALAWSFMLNVVVRRQVEADAEARRTLRELARKEHLSAIGELTARVVHQTRHQLGLIGIAAHRIGRRVGALTGEDARIVRDELAKLDEIQRELSDMLSRDLRAPSERKAGEPASYAALVGSVARRLEPVAQTRGVRMELGPLEPAEAAAPLHSDNIFHALFNVIENALTAARSVVRVEASARADALVISVLDDGPGLTPAVLDRAMDPFFTTKREGTGMGLAIARAAVEEEGAELLLGNRKGGGCQVEIVLRRH
jgi:two-component system sensor histidine kinase FlrB